MSVQAQAEAVAKTPADKTALERKFALERDRRKAAQTQASQNDAAYQSALQGAQQALTAKDYDTAQAKFQDAGKLFKTDAVLTGLKQIDAARAALAADAAKTAADAKKADTVRQLLATGNAALT